MVCLNQQTNVETYATGIKWIPIISNLSSILHMHFTECKIIQNPDLAPAFFAAIEQNRGFVWIFSTSRDAKLEKLDGEAATTLRSIGLSTKPFSSELTLARPYAMRTAAQPPTSIVNHFDSRRRQCSGRLARWYSRHYISKKIVWQFHQVVMS